MLVPLADHHIRDSTSYYVLYDRTATLGHPGEPHYLALQIRRNEGSFSFEALRLPLPAMAQSWLIHRGCPADAIDLRTDLGPGPADEATVALERRLMSDGDRFAMGYSHTRDSPDDAVTVVALRALDDREPVPYRVVIEEVDYEKWIRTLREIGCESAEEAMRWCQARIQGRATAPDAAPAVAHGPASSLAARQAHRPHRT